MDRATVLELARLCRLDLTEQDLERAERQLGRILAYFEQIREVDTEGVDPSPYPRELPLRARADRPGAVLDREQVLANAPAQRAGQFVVPRVVEG